MSTKIDFLNTDRLAKDQQIEELRSANRQFADDVQRSFGGASSGNRYSDIRLIDMKAMNPKKFDGKLDTPYRAWAKSVRAYCNASRPGFRKYPRWLEVQTSPIDSGLLSGVVWEHKEAASDALYDFLLLHSG